MYMIYKNIKDRKGQRYSKNMEISAISRVPQIKHKLNKERKY